MRCGIVEEAVNVGDRAPDFTLPDATGEQVSLSTLLEKGPVVLVWYRGGWCPYCNMHLRAMQEALDAFGDHGATMVAVSPELPGRSLRTVGKNELAFPVLTDAGNRVAREYGLVFTLTDAVAERYRESFDMTAWYGNDANELPLAATYVIDRGGVVRYAFLDADYRNRAEPGDVLDALETLEGE
jgi:peroxiredoxin